MDRERPAADAVRAMTTALQEEIRTGRFGRALRGDESPIADAQTPVESGGERFVLHGYTVDPDAVAAAIVERLLAGRTIAQPPRRRP
jgi:hypothetical protein